MRRGQSAVAQPEPLGSSEGVGGPGRRLPLGVRGLLLPLSFINLKNNVMSPVLFIRDISICLLSKQTIKLKCWEFLRECMPGSVSQKRVFP